MTADRSGYRSWNTTACTEHIVHIPGMGALSSYLCSACNTRLSAGLTEAARQLELIRLRKESMDASLKPVVDALLSISLALKHVVAHLDKTELATLTIGRSEERKVQAAT
jgi:hypothetical protein